MRPPKNVRPYNRISNHVSQSSGSLSLCGTKFTSNSLKKPIKNPARTGSDNGGPTSSISSSNISQKSSNPELKPGANVVIGGGKNRAKGLPQDSGSGTGAVEAVDDTVS